MPKEITFYVFLGEKRDPYKIYANSNLRNLTHITQKPSYVYVFHLYAQRNHSLSSTCIFEPKPFSRQNQKLTQHTAQLKKRFLQPTRSECIYLRHTKSNQANLDRVFSESRSGTIAHKNQKIITAVTHSTHPIRRNALIFLPAQIFHVR
jgi:hypothetical protein